MLNILEIINILSTAAFILYSNKGEEKKAVERRRLQGEPDSVAVPPHLVPEPVAEKAAAEKAAEEAATAPRQKKKHARRVTADKHTLNFGGGKKGKRSGDRVRQHSK